ncbi:MAG: hypothetical protein HC941_08500 [Microcoleus sp. SU_5_3]|nr:hypothetical protein [Microcoleus sp. SU_5_3]
MLASGLRSLLGAIALYPNLCNLTRSSIRVHNPFDTRWLEPLVNLPLVRATRD